MTGAQAPPKVISWPRPWARPKDAMLICVDWVLFGDIYRPSGCTVASGVVGVVVVIVVVGVCNRSQMRTSKCKLTCLIFRVSIGLDPG